MVYLARSRIFTKNKENIISVTKKLGLTQGTILQIEHEMRSQYEAEVRELLLENYLNSEDPYFTWGFMSLIDGGE